MNRRRQFAVRVINIEVKRFDFDCIKFSLSKLRLISSAVFTAVLGV